MSKILVVDDDKDMVFMVKLALEKNGFEVMTFRNGHEALKSLKISVPDLMIVDLTMPEMNGWQLCMKVREDGAFKNIPIIVLSGMVAQEGKAAANEPYNMLMPKPFEIENLVDKVKELLVSPS